MKKRVAMLLTAALMILAVHPAMAEEAKEFNIAYSICSVEGTFWEAPKDYLQKYADAYSEETGTKVNISYAAANWDAGKQNTDVKDLIAGKPDLMLISAVDSSAILSSIQACHEAGIPVITTLRQESPEAEGDQKADLYVGLDSIDQAYSTGISTFDRMFEDGYAPEDIHVINMVGDLADENAVNRSEGFKKSCEEKGIEDVQDITYEWDKDKLLSMLSAALLASPETNCIFVAADCDLGIAQNAIEQNGMWHKYGEEGYVYLCSQDGASEGLPFVIDGYCIADTCYDHALVVEQLWAEIANIIEGGEPETDEIKIKGRVITPENVYELENLWGLEYMS